MAAQITSNSVAYSTFRTCRSSASLALCEGNPPGTGGFPSQRDSDVEVFPCHTIIMPSNMETDGCIKIGGYFFSSLSKLQPNLHRTYQTLWSKNKILNHENRFIAVLCSELNTLFHCSWKIPKTFMVKVICIHSNHQWRNQTKPVLFERKLTTYQPDDNNDWFSQLYL